MAGRRAVVTGSGAGIGRAVVEALASEGVQVLAAELDVAACAELDELPGVHATQVDLGQPGCGDLIAERAAALLGGIDILVNNVGIAPARRSFLDVDDDSWRRTFDINLMSVVRTVRAAVPLLRASARASIVNVASTSGRYPEPMLVDYAASKAAVLSLTGALATEYGPEGIRVNAVAPGPTRTPLWDKPGGFVDALAERHRLPREDAVTHHVRDVRQMALGKPGTAHDVADAIVFLASDRTSHITGTVLAVHGGMATHLM
ncbi:3-oxoacyl-ACP reductase [Micromonospora globispora]|uniref:SDR family NAD(P)-dependent oxidoreductase n=1 Tax=Micromonospora globispora TaxID=1450148 RepID=UPI000D6F8DA7|nr:SDR family oxidoreductase [Micromonospora globispora]PWU55467.1 3-oxoacyl-ACP reductase [Micromonospora globispora]RQW91866.1 3-oxoacyl-ACP reductase [Micromonospora globispora]